MGRMFCNSTGGCNYCNPICSTCRQPAAGPCGWRKHMRNAWTEFKHAIFAIRGGKGGGWYE